MANTFPSGGGGGPAGDDGASDTADDGSTDDSTSDGGTGGGGGFSVAWGAIAPDFLTENGGVFRAFANNPRGFVVGAVLTTILEAVTGVVTTIVDQLVLLVGGSQPTRFDAPGEQLGLADVPVAIASTLTGVGSFGGQVLLDGIEAFNATLFDAAVAAGPFAPLVIIAIASVEAVVVIVVLRRLVYVAADLLQLGGLTE
ncbi:hypothetical protein [Halorubrum sp. CGM5_25_10-8B]|uniref:hypothetical protein n=1 Tax=Halorubrum sp. CGM5_25_10-8B TaxID=2518115 RepID=UPI001F5428F9|nr:hypothetical protein [Halorubrum sp. CGM5_25_10-8B]